MTFKGPSCRIAVSHFIMFVLLTYIFVTMGITLTEKQDPNFIVTRKAFFAVAVCFAIPLVLSLILLYGVIKEKIVFVRTWLFFTIPVTVLLMFLLLSGASYVAVNLQVYWGVILCAMPFVLTLWMSEGIIVVFSYYKKVESRIKKENPAYNVTP